MSSNEISTKTIERLSIYRRILQRELENNREFIYSHEIASISHRKPDQIRRDLMALDEVSSTKKGYKISELIENMNKLLGADTIQRMALIGVGNLGLALINFFKGRLKNLEITACFDIDPKKAGRVINGCRCYHLDEFKSIIKKEKITICIITVPDTQANTVSNKIINAGIKAIINFAPTPLKERANVYVENLDLTTFFEKTAYYAKQNK